MSALTVSVVALRLRLSVASSRAQSSALIIMRPASRASTPTALSLLVALALSPLLQGEAWPSSVLPSGLRDSWLARVLVGETATGKTAPATASAAYEPAQPSLVLVMQRGRNLYAGVEPGQPVAFSSRQMAAVRALEAERSDRLFDDPLSALLAGDEAMRQARTRAAALSK